MTKDKTPDNLIFVVKERLSDGSEVFNVVLGEHKWPAVMQGDAQDMARAIVDAIEHHTTETADFIDET